MNKSNQTRERVISEAARQFYLQGYRETTMRSLAAAVGIKHPSLFSIFKNKSAIASVILERYYDGLERTADDFTRTRLGVDCGTGERLLVFYALNFVLIYNDRKFAGFFSEFYDEDSATVDEVTRALDHLELGDAGEGDSEVAFRLDVKVLGMTAMMLVAELAEKSITPEFATEYFVRRIAASGRRDRAISDEKAEAFYSSFWDDIRATGDGIDIYRDYLMDKYEES